LLAAIPLGVSPSLGPHGVTGETPPPNLRERRPIAGRGRVVQQRAQARSVQALRRF